MLFGFLALVFVLKPFPCTIMFKTKAEREDLQKGQSKQLQSNHSYNGVSDIAETTLGRKGELTLSYSGHVEIKDSCPSASRINTTLYYWYDNTVHNFFLCQGLGEWKIEDSTDEQRSRKTCSRTWKDRLKQGAPLARWTEQRWQVRTSGPTGNSVEMRGVWFLKWFIKWFYSSNGFTCSFCPYLDF